MYTDLHSAQNCRITWQCYGQVVVFLVKLHAYAWKVSEIIWIIKSDQNVTNMWLYCDIAATWKSFSAGQHMVRSCKLRDALHLLNHLNMCLLLLQWRHEWRICSVAFGWTHSFEIHLQKLLCNNLQRIWFKKKKRKSNGNQRWRFVHYNLEVIIKPCVIMWLLQILENFKGSQHEMFLNKGLISV